MEAAVHLILRGWQMHPSVRETPEGAPQPAVLILGEGLHTLQHYAEERGIGCEEVIQLIGKAIQGGCK